MTDIPIIFSAPMVRALLDGRKTMTRRLAFKKNTEDCHPRARPESAWQRARPGDRLWVRETWRPHGDAPLSECTGPNDVLCAASADEAALAIHKWRSPIHMPRWASRLTLIVTATKIERLQDITVIDALAEGIRRQPIDVVGRGGILGYYYEDNPRAYCESAPQAFECLWCDLHGCDAWKANPEVVALSFTVHKTNIDALQVAR